MESSIPIEIAHDAHEPHGATDLLRQVEACDAP